MSTQDGPLSPHFQSLPLQTDLSFENLPNQPGISERMAQTAEKAPRGACVCWGMPFEVDKILLLSEGAASQEVVFAPRQAKWLVFLHTSDLRPLDPGPGGFISPMPGEGHLNELAAHYVVVYEDGSQERMEIRRRHQVGAFDRRWGENCFQAVVARKPYPLRAHHEQAFDDWGFSQTRASAGDWADWTNWLYAWRNPHPEKNIRGLRFEAQCGTLVVSAVSLGDVDENPTRWRMRQKALLHLPADMSFQPKLDENGLLAQVQLDLGQIISAARRPRYPDKNWETSYNNQLPELAQDEILLEYTAHPAACFHLWDKRVIPTAQVESEDKSLPIEAVLPARRRVTLRVIEKGSRKAVAVKLHVHGEHDEYLAPIDRHRIANPAWFEDYSVDFAHRWTHTCTYIPGETVIDLPLGKVYIEVAKGFEIRPLRTSVEIGPETDEVILEIEKVLPWREAGWVTADTHVHFLSPVTAMLEGAAEGVNIINLLASQWGELMTNVGDFDGRTTWGGRDSGGDGEYLVRVGTENRQHVLGHISLLGYNGRIITPMTTGGPDESAIGDPVEVLLTEWARQCHAQNGLVVLPHFPNPRAEHAASIIAGDIDALEMTSWGDLYSGISPYSLADWYRYLNCGYLVPAVGGTDKMSADTAVGTVRTYARIPPDRPFTYRAWMEAVRRGETFVSYGPLLEFSVAGRPMGSRLSLPPGGGTLDIVWQVASVTVPTTRVELIVNGEIRQTASLAPEGGAGSWSLNVDHSAWLALLVRGQYPDKSEMVAAHASPVMVEVPGKPLLAAADAVTILEQIEGALAYLDTTGTRAEDRVYKRMRLVLESAHRKLHNSLHQMGTYHDHTPMEQHAEHSV